VRCRHSAILDSMMSDSLTYTLGIEGGATRTSIILADCSDNVITQFTAGPCNLRLMSKDQLETHLVSIRERLPKIPDAIGIGLAGVRQQADLEVLITTVGRVNVLHRYWYCLGRVHVSLEERATDEN